MSKHDTKFINTKKKIQSGFLSMLNKKNFDDISITDICQEANINRGTFYNHYKTTYYLLNDLMKNTYESFNNSMRIYLKGKTITNIKNYLDKDVLIPYMKFVKKNRWFKFE